MQKIIIISFFTFCINNTYTQNDELLRVLNDQVVAFNKGDVERLVNNVSEDFKWYSLTSDTLIIEVTGKHNFKKSMENYFRSGRKVTSTIDSYSIDGDRISFREVVSHKNKSGEKVSSSAMGIYEIKEGKITRAWYFID